MDIRNPIIKESAGDPFILRDKGKYYMTATGGGKPNEFVCWCSEDLQNWSEPVPILRLADVSWAVSKAWAPTMVEKDGYYYFAFCADQQIGLAVGESPMGIFRDLLGRPLVAKTDYKLQTIDPAFLKTDDGKIYLAFGEGKCMMSEIALSPDGAQFVGDMVCLSDFLYSQASHPHDQFDISLYNEAPDFIKIGDRYLFSWSVYDVLDYRYSVRYAWSKDPMGPYIMPLDFDHDNVLLIGRHDITGCGHACVVEYEGEYYIVYGRHKKDRCSGFGRDMCCERIVFEDRDHLRAIPTALSR